MKKIKNLHIFGGGTVSHISSHLALSAPAYGATADMLERICEKRFGERFNIHVHKTKMAGGKELETATDISRLVNLVLKPDLNTKVVFFNCAIVDFEPKLVVVDGDSKVEFGKHDERLESRRDNPIIFTTPTQKIISSIRDDRKDIFLVGFKTTCGATRQEMYEKGLNLCKTSSVNLVLVNDVETHWNMIITPEEAAYHETDNREEALENLVEMAYYRSHLTFTQSTVIAGDPIPWTDDRIPSSIKTVVEYCIDGDAYKPFNGSTVGHFAVKLSDTEFLTSIRKSDFNKLPETGMVYVKTDGPDTVLAYGAKPSVGGQSQRIVFREHEGMDCIVHFHSPLKDDHVHDIPVRSQREVECGSHQCGKQTSDGLKQFGNLKAVYLDQHGPNIVFNRDIDPQEVIDFIDQNFDLTQKTGGYNIV